MAEDKVNPSSQSPRPLASFQEDQALSRKWLGAEGSSVLPLSETEKEKAFVKVDEEWKGDKGQELSPRRNISGRELCLWEEVRVQEFYQQQEEMTCQCEVGVTVQWGDGAQQELCNWEENMTVQYPWHEDDDRCQECFQWEEDPTYQELSQWEGEGYQDLSLLQDVQGHPHTYQLEEDKRDPELPEVGDSSDKKLSQGKGYSVKELPQWEKNESDQKQTQEEDSVSSQRLPQWGEGVRYKTGDKPLHTENDEDAQTCAQQRPSSSGSMGTKISGEAAHELPSTSSALGSPTEAEPAAVAAVAGAAEEEKPPEPLALKEEKAPDSPVLSDEVPSFSGTETPETETDSPESPGSESPASHSTPGCSQALLDLAEHISSEVVCKAMLEVQASGQQSEEQRDLEQSMAAELEAAAPAERKERPIFAPLSPCCLSSPSPRFLEDQALSKQQEEADRASDLSGQGLHGGQEREKGTLAGELEYDDEEDSELSHREMNKYQEVSQGETCTEQETSPGDAGSYQELSPGEACSEQELSPGEAGSYEELCSGEACTEKELSPGEVGSYQELCQAEDCMKQELYPEEYRSYLEFSDWEECTEKGLSQEVSNSQNPSNCEEYSEQELSSDVSNYQELSDWEESISQELSEEKDSIGQTVSKGNINRPSMQSSWESDSDKELIQDSWEHTSVDGTGVKPLLQKEHEWDNLSVLELSEEEDRDKRQGHFAEDEHPAPAPQEAWVKPCPQVPLYALPPHVKTQALRGLPVSPAFKKQVPEAGPAPCGFPSCSDPQMGAQAFRWQPAPRKEHPSHLRPALRALCRQLCCPCLAPQPED